MQLYQQNAHASLLHTADLKQAVLVEVFLRLYNRIYNCEIFLL